MFGFYNICKPAGPTSHDIVAAVRRRLPRRTKVGHAGTLDPFATGVLVLCVGPATRLASYVQTSEKAYRAEFTLGVVSTTDDCEGQIEAFETAPPDEEAIRDAIGQFVGEIQQVPPAHSAVHVDGRRAYALARKGETVELSARTVVIYEIVLLEYAWPQVWLDIRCGSGTYIRSLARDIGAALGVGGYCSALARTAVGAFVMAEAIAPDDLDPEAHLISPMTAVTHLPTLPLDDADVLRLAQGKEVLAGSLSTLPPGAEVAIVSQTGILLAMGELAGEAVQPRKVFVDVSG